MCSSDLLRSQSNLSETVIKALIALLKDEDRYIRRAAAEALGSQSNPSDTVIETLIAFLKDKEWEVRDAAVRALGSQSNLSDTVIKAIIALLKDNVWNVRRAAAKALGSQSHLSDTAIEALIALLKDEDGDVRDAAAGALGSQSNLSDMVLDAIGLSLESQRPAKTIYNVQYIESLYGSLLWRGFREQLSLYADGNGSCIVNQPSGLRRGRFEDGGHKQFLNEVSKGRRLWNTTGYELWNSSPGEGAQQGP